jgi:hypothetical protein
MKDVDFPSECWASMLEKRKDTAGFLDGGGAVLYKLHAVDP